MAAVNPGPDLSWWRQLGLVRRDFLGFLSRSADECGDIFIIRPTPAARIFVLNSAALAHEVTVTRAAEFTKSSQTRYMVGKFLGNGLVLSEGETHAAQRRLLQRSFGHRSIQAVARSSAQRTTSLLQSLPNTAVDVEPLMTRLSMGVILEHLVGAPSEQTDAGAAFRTLAEAIGGRFKAMPLPAWVPTSRNRREGAAVRAVADLVRTLLVQSRAEGHERPSVLSSLGKALDAGQLTFPEVRDQMITLLFAGHETVAKALSWTLLLLARHPEIQDRVRAEARETSDLPRLRYLTAVIKESMRLYPPVWVFDRSPLKKTMLGGLEVGAKDVVYVSPYLLHGSGRYFPRPTVFDPSRFEGQATIPDGAYMPFGAGPRSCIGQSLAFVETLAVLATIVKSHRVEDAGSGDVRPRPDATFAPGSAILLAFHPTEPIHVPKHQTPAPRETAREPGRVPRSVPEPRPETLGV